MISYCRRDYYFDNLKFILIIFVVVGYTIEPLIQTSSKLKILYSFIYAFHMPLFILVSGYFSKEYMNYDIQKLNQLIKY